MFAELLGGMRRALSQWGRETGDMVPEELSLDEFDRETGEPLPHRMCPRLRKAMPKHRFSVPIDPEIGPTRLVDVDRPDAPATWHDPSRH
jgi:hypothetical protein